MVWRIGQIVFNTSSPRRKETYVLSRLRLCLRRVMQISCKMILICVLFAVCASSLTTTSSPRVSGGLAIAGRWTPLASTATGGFNSVETVNSVLLSNKACRTNLGPFEIIAEECDGDISLMNFDNMEPTDPKTIRLLDVGSGWGNGAHPTTKLCMKFILKTVSKGDKVLDYGTGSGILSIAAAKLGASHCIAVDIDEDTLIAAEINGRINGVSDVMDVVHTRSVYVGEDRFPVSEVTVANILPVSSCLHTQPN